MIAFIGSVMSAVSYIIVRELRKTDEPMLIVAWFPFVAVPAVLPLVWMDPHWPEGWQWLLMAGIGVATQAGQIAMTRALHAETASRATGMSYVQIAFAFGWGLVIFGESIRWSSVVGALLIVAGTVGMGWWAGRSPARAGAPD
jgi:drug/metabolite transporter (DMT)-like permease